jgi:hypothetical protein
LRRFAALRILTAALSHIIMESYLKAKLNILRALGVIIAGGNISPDFRGPALPRNSLAKTGIFKSANQRRDSAQRSRRYRLHSRQSPLSSRAASVGHGAPLLAAGFFLYGVSNQIPASASTGKGAQPICRPTQLGSVRIAPLCPQREYRAERRSTSLDTSGPQRMMRGASAIGR